MMNSKICEAISVVVAARLGREAEFCLNGSGLGEQSVKDDKIRAAIFVDVANGVQLAILGHVPVSIHVPDVGQRRGKTIKITEAVFENSGPVIIIVGPPVVGKAAATANAELVLAVPIVVAEHDKLVHTTHQRGTGAGSHAVISLGMSEPDNHCGVGGIGKLIADLQDHIAETIAIDVARGLSTEHARGREG